MAQDKRTSPALGRAAAAGVTLILAARFLLFIDRYSVNILFWDQWDFLGPFFEGDPGFADLFLLRHGPHREGLGLIANKFLYPLTAWNVRAESFLIGGAIVAAMLVALWWKRRLFGAIGFADVCIPLIFLTLAQYETMTGTPNPAYSAFPLLLILFYAAALLLERTAVRYSLVLALDLFLIYTGCGVFMGIMTIAYFALEVYRSRGRRGPPSAALLLSVAAMGSFFAGYEFQSAVQCFEFPYRDLSAYPSFLVLLFSRITGIVRPLPLAAAVGAVALILACGLLAHHVGKLVRPGSVKSPVSMGIAVLLAYSLLFAVNAAIGRICLELPQAAQVSRYVTLLIPAFLAFYLHTTTIESRAARNGALLLLAAALVPGHVHVSRDAERLANGKRVWAACYYATEDIAYCDSLAGFPVYPDAQRTRLKEKLDYLKRHRLNLFSGTP